jgi:hypothetical protein
MIAEPLETGLATEIEKGKVTMKMSNKERGKWFEEKFGWDLLASRNVWAFGPEESGPNVLINDTLPSEVRFLRPSCFRPDWSWPCDSVNGSWFRPEAGLGAYVTGRHQAVVEYAREHQAGLPVGYARRSPV